MRSQKLLQHEEFREMLPFYRRSLFGEQAACFAATYSTEGSLPAVVLESIPEWIEDDGVRSLEDPQKYGNVLQHILEELGIAYISLGELVKDLGERVTCVKKELERINVARVGNRGPRNL